MKCNGCGGEFPDELLTGTLSYGNASIGNGGATRDAVRADHHKTLCPRCQHVMKDILLSSDLSEQWDSYEWSLIGDEYVEAYDDE